MKKVNSEIISLLARVTNKCVKTKDRGAFLLKLMTVESTADNETKIDKFFNELSTANDGDLMGALIDDLKEIRAICKKDNVAKEQTISYIEGLMGLKAAKDYVENMKD